MKSFLAAAVLLAATALGVGHSAAQTGTSSPGSLGTTSPLGSDFGQTPGNNSQITPAPFTNPAPCSDGSGAAALSSFDGAGLSPTTSFTTSGVGAESTSTPCNSVSSSGVTSAPNSAATTTSGANSSSMPSSASSSLGSSPNTGVTALGTNGLGTTGLGTTSLGSLPTQSGSPLQTATSPSTATQSETTCSGDLATPPTSTGTAQSLSGGVPDPAQSLGRSMTDAAQRLGGTATLPVTPVPCPTTTIP
jgi:hypothetical protein